MKIKGLLFKKNRKTLLKMKISNFLSLLFLSKQPNKFSHFAVQDNKYQTRTFSSASDDLFLKTLSLHEAILGNSPISVKISLASGADPTLLIQGRNGFFKGANALHMACYMGNEELLSEILNWLDNNNQLEVIDMKNGLGTTALEIATNHPFKSKELLSVFDEFKRNDNLNE